MSWYQLGTISTVSGSTTVTGAGTGWANQVKPGDVFTTDRDTLYMIEAVVSDTELTIWPAWVGAPLAGAAYSIIRNFTNTTNADLAARMSDLVARWQRRENEMIEWLSGTIAGGPNGDGTYPLTDLKGVTKMVKCPAWITGVLGDPTFQTASQIIADLQQRALDAEAARDAAQASAADADASETAAAAHAAAALESENASYASELAAELAEQNAKTSELAAAGSELAAANSEAAAAASRDAAAYLEGNALLYKGQAQASAAAALQSEQNADASEAGAAASAAAALQSEQNADASETAAKVSEAASAASQAAAKLSEDAARVSETAAAGSAAAAKVSEDAAKVSEVAAKASQDAAAASEENADASETAALAHEQSAKKWAEESEDIPVEVVDNGDGTSTTLYSAKHHRAKIAAAVAAAAASEEAALASQNAARNSELAADADAASALASKDAAAASAAAALQSEQAADAHRSAAELSEVAAGDHEAAAAAAESLAAASADLARRWAEAPANVDVDGVGTRSAYHWAMQAAASLTGGLVWRGLYDASVGGFPAAPTNGDYYRIGVGGTLPAPVGLVESGMALIYSDANGWQSIGDVENVTSVSGRIGDVTTEQILTDLKTIDGDGSGLDADLLDGRHASDFALAVDTQEQLRAANSTSLIYSIIFG